MSEYTTCTEEYDENGRVLEGFHGAFEFPVTKPTEYVSHIVCIIMYIMYVHLVYAYV